MFETLKNTHRMAKMGFNWAGVTGIDPRDNGQIVKRATQYMSNLGHTPEDAWVLSMLSWIEGIPWPENKRMMAQGMLTFLRSPEVRSCLSEEVIEAGLANADTVLSSF